MCINSFHISLLCPFLSSVYFGMGWFWYLNMHITFGSIPGLICSKFLRRLGLVCWLFKLRASSGFFHRWEGHIFLWTKVLLGCVCECVVMIGVQDLIVNAQDKKSTQSCLSLSIQEFANFLKICSWHCHPSAIHSSAYLTPLDYVGVSFPSRWLWLEHFKFHLEKWCIFPKLLRNLKCFLS